MIRYADRLFIVGYTGSGKSTLARSIFGTVQGPRFIIDPSDSSLTADVARFGATVHGPPDPEAVAAQLDEHAALDTIRYVPNDPTDRAEYDAVYRWLFDHFPRFTWLDEAGLAAPARRAPNMVTRYLVQGRKRQLGHLACHTRPREVSRNLIAQSQHVALFALPNPDDRDHVASAVGLTPSTLEQHMGELEPHGFLWWNVRTRDLTLCPPLDVQEAA